MENETTKLRERLAMIRIDLGLKQGEMAEKLRCSRNTLVNYESGLTTPDIETLRRYHELGNAPYEWLIDGEEISDYELYVKIKKMSKFDREKLFEIYEILKK